MTATDLMILGAFVFALCALLVLTYLIPKRLVRFVLRLFDA